MTDLQYTYDTPTPGRDVTAVMGRRIVAWIIDFILYVGLAIGLFALLAEYVEVPDSTAFLDACSQLQLQDGDAAAGCIELGDRAYITSNGDNGIQTLAALGYFVFFVLMQGILGASPGKLVTGLRVVKADGRRAGVGRSLLRTILWVVDGAPWILPLVGFITGLTTTGHRRVGDMAASTYVVARKDVGQPITTGAPVAPPAQGAWGAPPPMPGQMTGQVPGPPTGPPMAPPPGMATPPPATPSPSTPAPATPAVDDLTPDISGVPDESPAPPPVPETDEPTWQPPGLEETAPPFPTGLDEPAEPPTTPEIDGPVDIAAPEVEASDDWWAGPEADPSANVPEAPPEADTPPEMPTWEDPSITPDTSGDTWAPPTTPGSDIGETENTSPTAGPAPFTAPGADPVSDAPPAPEPAPRPPPQWDQARNTYIQWEPALQKWLQWDEPAQRWKDIDS